MPEGHQEPPRRFPKSPGGPSKCQLARLNWPQPSKVTKRLQRGAQTTKPTFCAQLQPEVGRESPGEPQESQSEPQEVQSDRKGGKRPQKGSQKASKKHTPEAPKMVPEVDPDTGIINSWISMPLCSRLQKFRIRQPPIRSNF